MKQTENKVIRIFKGYMDIKKGFVEKADGQLYTAQYGNDIDGWEEIGTRWYLAEIEADIAGFLKSQSHK